MSRLPAPWREKFNSFSVDSKNYLCMDGRLSNPDKFTRFGYELNSLRTPW